MAAAPHTVPEAPGAHGEATASTEHASGGLPQFDFAQWPGQIAWFLIIFAVLLFLMRKVFVPRIGGGIEERDARITGDVAEARRLKNEAELQAQEAAAEMAKARAASQKVALDARSKAQAEIAERLSTEEAKLAETVAAAETKILAARDKSLGNVRTIAADTAQAIVERLTGQAASAKEIDAISTGRA